MTREVVVFLGPTLERDRAMAELDADYRPPVRLGDVVRAVHGGAAVIGIVDGLFDGTPPVWHKEILHALSVGVAVYGASSMGALRAAELEAFGMRGVGAIFASFRDGELEDDDEVAVVHGVGPSYRPLCEAMVNLRHGLSEAVAATILDEGQRAALIERSKARHYCERSWRSLFADARTLLGEAKAGELETFVESTRPNLKRDDALALLRTIAADCKAGRGPSPPSFSFERTIFWDKLVRTSLAAGSGDIREETLRREALLRAEGPELQRAALTWHLLEEAAARLGLEPSTEELREAKARFRRDRGLFSKQAVTAWVERNHVDADDFDRLARWTWLVERLTSLWAARLRAPMLLELKRSDRYAKLCEELEERDAVLQARGLERPTLEDCDLTLDELLAWYGRRVVLHDRDLNSHASRLRFDTTGELITHLLRAYLHERERSKTE